MAKTDFKNVAEYLAAQPASIRPTLKSVRTTIRKALPKAEEVISYQMPAYKVDGRLVLYFAGWKTHYSLYPVNRGLVQMLGEDLERYEVNDKGTIRFSLTEAVPARLIARLAKLRAQQVGERAALKKPAKRRVSTSRGRRT